MPEMNHFKLLDQAQAMSGRDLVRYTHSTEIRELPELHLFALVLALSSKLDEALDRLDANTPDTVLAASAAHWEVPE
jgi:hypothetical protein